MWEDEEKKLNLKKMCEKEVNKNWNYKDVRKTEEKSEY